MFIRHSPPPPRPPSRYRHHWLLYNCLLITSVKGKRVFYDIQAIPCHTVGRYGSSDHDGIRKFKKQEI
jgi:hypothetical protein